MPSFRIDLISPLQNKISKLLSSIAWIYIKVRSKGLIRICIKIDVDNYQIPHSVHF